MGETTSSYQHMLHDLAEELRLPEPLLESLLGLNTSPNRLNPLAAIEAFTHVLYLCSPWLANPQHYLRWFLSVKIPPLDYLTAAELFLTTGGADRLILYLEKLATSDAIEESFC